MLSILESYDIWYASHGGNLNFHGSVSQMEATDAKNNFLCSITKHNLRYIKFYDGDQAKEQLLVNT